MPLVAARGWLSFWLSVLCIDFRYTKATFISIKKKKIRKMFTRKSLSMSPEKFIMEEKFSYFSFAVMRMSSSGWSFTSAPVK